MRKRGSVEAWKRGSTETWRGAAWSEGSVGGSDRAKHIDLGEHFVHDAVAKGVLKLMSIASAANVADLLIKPPGFGLFPQLRKRLMGY
jgi:hypothetical protein